jgi:hypothetical protein
VLINQYSMHAELDQVAGWPFGSRRAPVALAISKFRAPNAIAG